MRFGDHLEFLSKNSSSVLSCTTLIINQTIQNQPKRAATNFLVQPYITKLNHCSFKHRDTVHADFIFHWSYHMECLGKSRKKYHVMI